MRWIDHLFTGVTLSVSKPHSYGSLPDFHDAQGNGALDVGQAAANILHICVGQEGHVRRSSSSSPTSSVASPPLQRHLTDSIMRYLPFCLGKGSQVGLRGAERDYANPSEPLSPYDLPSASSSPSAHSSTPVAGSPQTPFLSNLMHTFADRMSHSFDPHPFGHDSQPYTGIDLPPPGVLELLDHFYPSKIHKLAMLDLLALGHCDAHELCHGGLLDVRPVPVAPEDDTVPSSSDSARKMSLDMPFPPPDGLEEDEPLAGGVALAPSTKSYFMPHAPEVRSILLPARNYMSFSRVARVVERMVQDGGPGQLWSLAFRDSTYHGDFHDSLLVTLRRSPQIVSVTFLNSAAQKDTHLGFLAGHLPSSVRFVSFQGSLSKESIQALCIYLQTENACFKPPLEAQFTPAPSPEPGASSPSSLFSCSPTQGLVGLAITGCMLDATEVSYIKELLGEGCAKDKGPSPSLAKRAFGSGSGPLMSKAAIPTSRPSLPPTPPVPRIRGLRLLDLSFNRLTDAVCADLLRAAAMGPLQGIELSGNFIQRGAAFCEVLTTAVGISGATHNPNPNRDVSGATHTSRLQYVGLSYNSISGHCFTAILDGLQDQSSLSALDLSCNELNHTQQSAMALRQFLRHNKTLRNLDLSHNKFTHETLRSIHLGLAENETMLLMPLASNPAALASSELQHIQTKLSRNREVYRELADASARERRAEAEADALCRAASSKLGDGRFAEAYDSNGTALGLYRGPIALALAEGADPDSLAVARAMAIRSADASFDVTPRDRDGLPLPASAAPHPAPLPNVLNVFFSTPLAWRDRTNQLHPLEVLNYSAERDALVQVFKVNQ